MHWCRESVPFTALALMVCLCTAVAVWAQQKPVEEKLNKLVSDVEQKAGSRDPSVVEDAVKIFVNKIEVLGRLEKPQAVFIVPGSDPRVDDIGIDRSFFQEIFRPVERDAVRRTLDRHALDYIPW